MELGNEAGSSACVINALPDRTSARELMPVNNNFKYLFMFVPPVFYKISITADPRFWHYNIFTIYLMKISSE